LIAERANFEAQLPPHLHRSVKWVIENFPPTSSDSGEAPSNWKNNYAKALEAAETLNCCIPALEEELKDKKVSIETTRGKELPIETPPDILHHEESTPPSTNNQSDNKLISDLVNAVKAAIPPPPTATSLFTDNQFSQLMDALRLNSTLSRQAESVPAEQDFTTKDLSFRPQDLGLFEPNNKAKSPTSFQDGKTVYHDVFSFTARVRTRTEGNKSGSWSAQNVAAKLDLCLRGDAETWYTNELSPVTRAGFSTNLGFWCSALEHRFRDSPTVALDKLEKLRYTIHDARIQQSPEEYVQNIVVLGKNAGTVTTEYAQVLTAYKHIDAPLRLALPKPTISTTLTEFMTNITDAKDIWFDIYKPSPSSSFRPQQINRGTPNPRYRNFDYPHHNSFQQNLHSQIIAKPDLNQTQTSDQNKGRRQYGQVDSNPYRNKQNFGMRPVARKDKATRYDEKFNSARNYPADINENDQIEISNNEPNNQEMEHNPYEEVYLHRMDNSSDQESISDNRPEDAEWTNPAYNYHFTNFQKPGINCVVCEVCAASFSSRNKLHQHIRFLHPKTPAKASKLLPPLTTNYSLHAFHNSDTIQPSLQVVTSKAPENLLP
ncbi:hypothetical protein K3495_g15118, partial [Podosphaera aphanis]